jgi:hydrogenase maturation protein HypF
VSVAGRRIEVRGTVQGVGFRPWVCRLARQHGLEGSVWNDAQGVTIEVFGEEASIASLVVRLSSEPPHTARVEQVECRAIGASATHELPGFSISESRTTSRARLSLAPDLATCPECAREIFDPEDRRHRYAFTSCTACGPRFSIARALPFDRNTTSMAGFGLCDACRCEYERPAERRFHAQTTACPSCGPRLELRSAAGGHIEPADPDGLEHAGVIAGAARVLRSARILAVKGIGGFHLACDATSEWAVRRLRHRKRREAKPFAVMVRDVGEAEALAHLNDAERELLGRVERPIVLAHARTDTGLAHSVAPDSPFVGLLLPYTPLHHLLLAATARPLVMTSGNLCSEPIVHRDAEALARLGGVSDAFLLHDREIEVRCDDSVARVAAGAPLLLRRSRGFVPEPIRLARAMARPVLACGAQLKNTFCLAVEDRAYLGPHVGDLESPESQDALAEAIGHLELLLGVEPEVVAHDLHPDYASTRYAKGRSGTHVGVQHHHAHVASVLAEHDQSGPVLGLAWDGTGLGSDGAAWGGELLLADTRGFERLATFRPLPLAGGDQAVREVWRLGLAALDDAFGETASLEDLALFERVDRRRVGDVRRLLEAGLNSPRAHGVGRYFDALGALVLGQADSRYEGEVALAWNGIADPAEQRVYPFEINARRTPPEVDLRPLVREAVSDVRGNVGPATISGRFHATLAAIAEDLVRRAAARSGRRPVVLSGGCFQNARLVEDVLARLQPEFEVLVPRLSPPGDGGIALGQALVADAVVRAGG